MRWLAVGLVACGAHPARAHAPEHAPAVVAPAVTPAPTPTERALMAPCLVVSAEEARAVMVEGTLVATRGTSGPTPFALRLLSPRCVAGLPRVSFLTEVQIAHTGTDLRPLVDARVRIRGDAIVGESDVGAPAIIVLAADIERLAPPERD
jgi:hypothetical protein